jgi:DNA repair protein RecO (recombination protein O)
MYIDDKGIVLQCVKYNDKAFIAHLFTASRGHVSFVINGTHGKRSGTMARLFQPLTFLSFQWDAKPNSSLQRMKEARLLFVQQDIPFHPIKRSVAMLLTEFMAYTLRNEAANPDLYLYMEHSFRWFDMAEEGYANFHLVFLLKLARFLGIAPNMEAYSDGDLFDLISGHFAPHGVASDTIMSVNDTLLLFLLNGATYETMDSISMNRHDRARLVRYLATYYGQHAVNFPTLQSLDILQDLFFA